MKKTIGISLLLCCFSSAFAQGAITREFARALEKFGGGEVRTLLKSGTDLTSSTLSPYFLESSPALTAFMMPSVDVLPVKLQERVSRYAVVNRIQQLLALHSPATQFPIQANYTTPSLQALNGYSKELGKGDFERFEENAGMGYVSYFSSLIKVLYPQGHFDTHYAINDWNKLQHYPFTYSEPIIPDKENAKNTIWTTYFSFSMDGPRDVSAINVVERGYRSRWTERENLFIDTLIPDLETGKFISYNQSIEPVWDYILKNFPKKTKVEFYSPRKPGWISIPNVGTFQRKKALVLSNGNKAGVIINLAPHNKQAYLLKDAIAGQYKFYLQPVGEPIPVPEDVSKIIKINSVYLSYVLYVAPYERGPLFKLENFENLPKGENK